MSLVDNELFDCLNTLLKKRSAGAVRRSLCRFVHVNSALWRNECRQFDRYIQRVRRGEANAEWWFLAAAVLRWDIRITLRTSTYRAVFSSKRSRSANHVKPTLHLKYNYASGKYRLNNLFQCSAALVDCFDYLFIQRWLLVGVRRMRRHNPLPSSYQSRALALQHRGSNTRSAQINHTQAQRRGCRRRGSRWR